MMQLFCGESENGTGTLQKFKHSMARPFIRTKEKSNIMGFANSTQPNKHEHDSTEDLTVFLSMFETKHVLELALLQYEGL